MKNGLLIIHYNDYESLNNLIENVKNYSIINKIIIVDNNSKNEVKEKIRTLTSKKVKLIENKENKGFAAAINIGSKELIKALGPCNIIISNADVIINKEEDIKALIKELDKENAGIVAPTIVENDHLNRGWRQPSPLLDSMLNLVLIHRFFRKKYVFYKEEHYQNRISIVDVVSGCFFLIKSNVLEKINFLDENTFLYYEENILAKKMQEKKLDLLVCNDVLIIHNHSVSVDKNLKKINKLKIQKQSQYYFHVNYNHANIFEKTMLKVTTFVNRQILRIIYFIKDMK